MLDLNQLRKQLRDLQLGKDAAQRQAIQALKQYSDDDWVGVPADLIQSLHKTLQACLKNGQTFLHKDVALTLGSLGLRAKASIPLLIDQLRDGVPDVNREAAAVALGRMGKAAKDAVSPLLALVTSPRPGLCNQAIRALGNIGQVDKQVRTTLAGLWPMAEQLQNSTAQLAITLCKLRIPARNLASVLARTLMSHPEASLRRTAAEALAYCSPNELEVVPALLAASMNDSNDDVKRVAAAGLEQMKVTQEKAISLCAKQLADSTYAEAALRKSGAAAVPALIKVLTSENPQTRVKAVRTLSTLGEIAASAVDRLQILVEDPDLEVRLAVAKSFWNIAKNADAAVPILIDLLKPKTVASLEGEEPRRMFLQSVLETLRRIGPPARAATPAIARMTKDRNRHVAESAAAALKLIDPPKAKVS